MIKANSKLVTASVAAALALNMLLPIAAGAEDGASVDVRGEAAAEYEVRAPRDVATGQSSGKRIAAGAFCNAIAELGTRLDGRFGDRLKELKTKRDERLKTVREHRDSKTMAHDDWKEQRASAHVKLEVRATTDVQKAALVKFKADMEVAVKVRVAALETARKTFRDGMDKVIAERKAAEDKIVEAYRAAIKAAAVKAKADCAAKVDAETVRADFRASLEAAHAKFEADRKALDTAAKVKALVEARKAAFKKAVDDFKAAAEKARSELKASYNVKANVK